MDAGRKKIWVKALRSGKYDQAEGALRRAADSNGTSYAYCCLGVLCDVLPETSFDTGRVRVRPEGIKGLIAAYDFEIEDDVFAPATEDNAVIEDDEFPEWMLDYLDMTQDQQITLIKMNDTGVPFSKIADYIEENL